MGAGVGKGIGKGGKGYAHIPLYIFNCILPYIIFYIKTLINIFCYVGHASHGA